MTRRACRFRARRLFAGAALAVLVGTTGAAARCAAEDADSTRSPEEEFIFSEGDIVTSATLTPKPAALAPSSVTVISAEEIRRFGYRTLADLLENTAGFTVDSDRGVEYAGARGFRGPGDSNNRILILLDGHPLNDEWGGSSAISEGLGVNLIRAQRVEIVRGPGSALYGSNALFGVVNIVSASGAAAAGANVWTAEDARARNGSGSFPLRAAVAAEGGTNEWGDIHLEVEGSSERLGSVVVTGSILSSSGEPVISLPPPLGGTEGFEVSDVDGAHGFDASLSYNKGALSVDGLFSGLRKTLPAGNFGSIPGDRLANTAHERGFVRGRYSLDWLGVNTTFSLSQDVFDYDGRFPQGTQQAPVLVAGGTDNWTTAGLLVRADAPGRQEITVGADHRWHRVEGGVCAQDRGGVELWRNDLPNDTYDLWSVFAQDIVAIGGGVSVTAGGRYDHYPFFGGELTGRAALIWEADERTVLKAIVGSAFRAPSASEIYYNKYNQSGIEPKKLEPEELTTGEIAAEREIYPGARLRASVFRATVERLIDLMPVSAEDVFYANRQAAVTTGAEVEARWIASSGLMAHGNVSYQEVVDRDTDLRLANSPRFVAGGGVSVPVVPDVLYASAVVRGMGERTTLAGSKTAPYAVADAAVVYKSPALPFEVSVRAQNLLDTEYSDPGSAFVAFDEIPQPGRFVAVRVLYAF